MTSEARALRGQIREWRNGRAEIPLSEALGDAYITMFATIMLGAMGFNVVRQLRVEATGACSTTTCGDARQILPWVFALGIIAVVLLVARLFGPSLASPAEGSWLLASPADRKSLLRPRLLVIAAVSLVGGGVLGAVDTTLGGFGAWTAVTFTVIIAAASVCAVMFASIDQSRELGVGRIVTWVLGGLVWAGLVLLTVGKAPTSLPQTDHVTAFAIAVGAALVLLAALLIWRATGYLGNLRQGTLTSGGSLLSNLSGAFFSLDTLLVYDLLMARRWRDRATVRPVRGGPGGAWALIWRDVIRLRRSVHTILLLAAALVIPYVAAALELGKAVTIIGAFTGFLAGLGLCSGLRVLARTPGLIRCFPMSAPLVRATGVVVPTIVLIVWGLATAPAIHHALAPASWGTSLGVGLATGMATVASVTRWIMAAPSDYSAPLITSPAGAIPPSLFGNLFRGLDVLLLVSAPMLLFDAPAKGANISMLLSELVVAILLLKKPKTH